jgi:hypothetical protein
MRTEAGKKDFKVIDCGGNIKRLNLVDDITEACILKKTNVYIKSNIDCHNCFHNETYDINIGICKQGHIEFERRHIEAGYADHYENFFSAMTIHDNKFYAAYFNDGAKEIYTETREEVKQEFFIQCPACSKPATTRSTEKKSEVKLSNYEEAKKKEDKIIKVNKPSYMISTSANGNRVVKMMWDGKHATYHTIATEGWQKKLWLQFCEMYCEDFKDFCDFEFAQAKKKKLKELTLRENKNGYYRITDHTYV